MTQRGAGYVKAIEDYVRNAPASQQNALTRALLGNASPRSAIKAKCLTCCNFDRSEIENCTVRLCPLWSYRPFQNSEAGR